MYIKTEHEMALIIEGGRILGGVLEKLAGMVQPGVSAWEIDRKAEQFIRKAGGLPVFKGYKTQPGDTPFPCTVCISLNEEVVHGIASKDKIFSEGDLVSIDIGMEYPKKSGEGRNVMDLSPTQRSRLVLALFQKTKLNSSMLRARLYTKAYQR